MRYRLILWDFDGTVANTSEDVWESLRYAATLVNATFSETFTGNNAHLNKPLAWIFRYLTPTVNDELFETFIRAVELHYQQYNAFEHTTMYEGLLQLIISLRSHGVAQVIVTNKQHKALEKVLFTKEWCSLFDDWISADQYRSEHGRLINKSEMIQIMCQRFHAEASSCLLIGDSSSDIEAAQVNNIDSIGVTYGDGDTKKLEQSEPTYIAHHGNELSRIIFSSHVPYVPQESLLITRRGHNDV